MYPSIKKLTFLQKYGLANFLIIVIFVVMFFILLFVADFLEKMRIEIRIEDWLGLHLITKDQYDIFVKLVDSMFFVDVFALAFVFCLLGYIIYIIVRSFYSQFYVGSVHFDEVYEFSYALKNIGFTHPSDQIHFVVKNEIPVYAATKPVLYTINKSVKVKLLPNHVYCVLKKDFFSMLIGDKRLCIEKDDYLELIDMYKKFDENNNSVDELKGIVVFDEIKKDTTAAMHGKQAKRDAEKFDYYRIAIPVADRLSISFSGQKYTRSDIECAFFEELERQHNFKDSVVVLAVDKEGHLRSWAMEALRKRLVNMVEKESGRPSKHKKVYSR